jgi:hypothetical protein
MAVPGLDPGIVPAIPIAEHRAFLIEIDKPGDDEWALLTKSRSAIICRCHDDRRAHFLPPP